MLTDTVTGRERRRAPRFPVVLAVELSTAEKPARCGVTRDASSCGMLIVTASRFAEGEQLDVAVHGHAGAFARVRGRIVRIDENPFSSPEPWRYRLAVDLDAPLAAELLEPSVWTRARRS